ncbi:MAG: hypothetical protein UIM53_08780 [Acutalibacteraceae bacterium]|nr:hypothetical protein [Acutalibacteraceae bacterium]
MKTVIVQVAKDYLCLTCCEPILQAKDQKKKEATVDLSYRFTAPYVKPLDTQYMEGKESVWEIPKAFATMVNDGLREMKRPEVKEVILLVEEFDLVSSEFQHVRCKKKMLDNIAVENLKEVLQDDVKQFSVITTTYGTPAKEIPEMTSKTFGIPRALSSELTKRFSDMGLTLVKITPADIPMLKISREVVYSFNKTICYLSIDYAALRVVLVRDSLPLYCHTFRSPITEAIDIIAQDRQMSINEALEYIKKNGLTSDYEGNTEEASRRIHNLREDIMADVVHNINLVAMSLNLTIDQVVLSDYVGFFPKVINIVKMMGISLDVDVITDQFNTKMAVPELDIDARDSGFKTGSFILFNNLMNSGDKYKNNLMVGLQPLKEKSINIGKQATWAFAIVVGAAIVACSGYYAFLHIQKSMDDAKLKEDKYVKAANLLQRQEDIKQKLKDQVKDAAKLPNCPLYMSDTLEQTKKQVTDNVNSINGYNLTYQEKTDGPVITVPISGSIDSFNDLIGLMDDIRADEFFTVSNSFNIADSKTETKKGYEFNITLSNAVDTEDEEEKLAVMNGSSSSKVEKATEAATEK